MERSHKFEKLIHINNELNSIDDFDAILDKILTEARNLTDADAGTIYLNHANKLRFSYTQNDTLFTSNLDNNNLYLNSTLPIDESSIAGYVALHKEILNIPDVYQLTNTLPYSFDSSWDKKNNYKTTSVLTVPIISGQGNNVGIIQLINSKNDSNKIVPFNQDSELLALSFAATAGSHIERANLTREMILRMIKMAELRDPKETGPHVHRVGAISAELYEHWARAKKIDPHTLKRIKGNLRLSSMLHDVGKIAISDLILKKPGKFTEDERKTMKLHTVWGAQLFQNSNSELDEMSALISLHHHENWDGSGYPGTLTGTYDINDEIGPLGKGLEKEDISIYARIVKIADVYDALVSQRVYKQAWDERDALNNLEQHSGTHFDPLLIEHFFEIYKTVQAIEKKYQD